MLGHSNGSLLARASVQRPAHGATFATAAGSFALPTVGQLLPVATPSLGSAVSVPFWNNDTTSFTLPLLLADLNLARTVLDPVYQAVVEEAAVVGGPDGIIDRATITDPVTGRPDPLVFLRRYLPSLRDPLPTFDVLRDVAGGLINLNATPDANHLLLDLNAGTSPGVNPWAARVGEVIATFGVHPLGWFTRQPVATETGATACRKKIAKVDMQRVLFLRHYGPRRSFRVEESGRRAYHPSGGSLLAGLVIVAASVIHRGPAESAEVSQTKRSGSSAGDRHRTGGRDTEAWIIGFEGTKGFVMGKPTIGMLEPAYSREPGAEDEAEDRIVAGEGYVVGEVELVVDTFLSSVQVKFNASRTARSIPRTATTAGGSANARTSGPPRYPVRGRRSWASTARPTRPSVPSGLWWCRMSQPPSCRDALERVATPPARSRSSSRCGPPSSSR